jgi:hypothetical protein
MHAVVTAPTMPHAAQVVFCDSCRCQTTADDAKHQCCHKGDIAEPFAAGRRFFRHVQSPIRSGA